MNRELSTILTYGGLAAGAIALYNQLSKPAAAAPAPAPALGTPSSYYDPNANNIMQVQPPGVDPNTIMQYDANGNPIMQVQPPGSESGAHPWWRWHRRSHDFNSVQGYQQPWWGNGGVPSPYDPTSTFSSPYGVGYDPYAYYDYDAEFVEQPGTLLSQRAQFV